MSPVRVLVGNSSVQGKKADFFILESEKVRLEDVREVELGVCLPSFVRRRDVFYSTGIREDLENAISQFLESIDNVDGIVVVAECCCVDILLYTVEALRDQCPRTQIELQITGEVTGDVSYAIELADRVVCAEEGAADATFDLELVFRTECLQIASRGFASLRALAEKRLILKNGYEPMPFDTLFQARGMKVALHTRKRTQYHGVLHEFDDNGNFRVSNTVEHNDDVILDMGEMVINGINVVLVDICE